MPIAHDTGGHPVSGANAEGLAAWERATHELRCLVDDPLTRTNEAIAAAPAMTIAHLTRAWLFLLGTEPGTFAAARRSIERAATLSATPREEAHLHAASALADGRWFEASDRLAALSAEYPRDALALQVGHQIDFFTGDRTRLRDRIARALPAWDAGRPGYHAVLGMHAFGLEECGDYAAAERAGERAVDLEARDSWAWHAVAHVHEMRQDIAAGIGWLAPNEAIWSEGSFLSVHNQWHLALFELEGDDHEAVLARYDRAIGGSLVLELVDSSAMLWRLMLRGVDVGGRWGPVAEGWRRLPDVANYAFNDVHAMLAYVGAGDEAGQARALAALRRAAHDGDGQADNRVFAGEVGLPAAEAIQAFGRGRSARAVELLRPLRKVAHRFGGSHAQRDLLELTLIEAALRAGDAPLARDLAQERVGHRPDSPLARRFVARAAALAPGAADA